MRLHAVNPSQLIGVLVGAFGLTVSLRWIFLIDWIGRLLPSSAEMGINTPVMFIAAGMCCFGLAVPKKSPRFIRIVVEICAWLLVILPGLILVQHIFDWNLGLDFLRTPRLPTPDVPHPGRVAPNTCIGFLAAGLGFLWIQRAGKPRTTWPLTLAICILTLIGVMGLIGYLLKIETLYRLSNLNRMLPGTAIGLTVLSVGLWLLRDRFVEDDARSTEKHARRIAKRSILALTLVAVSAGISGFVVLRESFEKTVADGALLTAKTNATSLTNTLDVALWFPRTVATWPSVSETLDKLGRDPHDAAMRMFLTKVGDSFLTAGLSGVQFFGTDGQLLVASGTTVGSAAMSVDELRTDGQSAQLRWRDGYILSTQNQVLANGRAVGRVITEQRLTVFDRLLSDIRSSSDSSDALICSRVGDQASCAPTRFYRTPFQIQMFRHNGELNLPINYALAGASGITIIPDLRGVDVLAAYVPIQPYGLGLVVKTDVRTLYAPLRERIQLLIVLLVALVAIGSSAMRMRVRPLLEQMLREQRRTKVILDNSNDAFIAIDKIGKITDWNLQAERIFGWPASVAIGQNLADLIIPEDQREAHRAGFKVFMLTGQGPVINRRIEVMALHHQGHEVLIELAVAAWRDGDGYVANVFARDITESKAAEQKLAASEQRLRDITDNLPALVSYIDKDLHYRFANATYAQWFEVDPVSLIGRSMLDVVGPQAFAQIQPHLQRAMHGERVRFERHASERPGEVHYLVNFNPDIGPDGVVRGCYAMVLDISARKTAELDRANSERRLRDVTNNIPAMVGYFDAEEQCLFANDAGLRSLNLSRDDMKGLTLRRALGESNYAQHKPHVHQALAGHRAQFDGTVPYKGGEAYFQAHLVPDFSASGGVQGFYLMSFDVTALKQAELKRADSERRLRAITDNVPALISQFDRDGTVLFSNPYCAQVYGTTPQAWLGKTLRDVRGDEEHVRLQPYIDRVLNGESVVFESTATLDGVVRDFQQSYVPDIAADGMVNGFYSVSFEITNRKRDEQRVAASEKRLRDITDNLPVLISYIDSEERLTFVNSTFETWTGIVSESVLGLPFKEAIGMELYEPRRNYLRLALGGERVRFDIESQTTGSRRFLHTEYIPDLTTEGQVAGIYTMSTDVTGLKIAEQKLSALALFDTLTGLPNRHQFNQTLAQALARAGRSGEAMALMFLDVDHFKSINDTLGHAAGDAVLKEFAVRLQQSVRVTDMVARLAGDEFVIILEAIRTEAEPQFVAQKILTHVTKAFEIEGRELPVTTSIGIAIHSSGLTTPGELLAKADSALYAAKAAGRNTFHSKDQ